MDNYKILYYREENDSIPLIKECNAPSPFAARLQVYAIYPKAVICRIEKIKAPLAQPAEAMDLKSIQSRFESEREYQ